MKRVTLTIAIYAFIGAGLTVLVSWACETFAGESLVISYEQPSDPLLMPGLHEPPAGWDVRTWVEFEGFGVGGVWVSEMPWVASTLGWIEDSQNRIKIRYFAGWPLRCLVRSDRFDSRFDYSAEQRAWDVGMRSPWRKHMAGGYRRDLLAIRPMPIRFLANTLFWGLIAWIPLRGIGLYRLRRRISRGLCIKCAYQLGSIETCPECGTPAAARTMTR
ncbi:MAG: hypothetical protein Phyf2KO_08400 [Phycisphaerales bacterium]